MSPDVAMCRNDACPQRKSCYRHEAKADKWWQTYGEFKPDTEGYCSHYMAVEWKPKRKRGKK